MTVIRMTCLSLSEELSVWLLLAIAVGGQKLSVKLQDLSAKKLYGPRNRDSRGACWVEIQGGGAGWAGLPRDLS